MTRTLNRLLLSLKRDHVSIGLVNNFATLHESLQQTRLIVEGSGAAATFNDWQHIAEGLFEMEAGALKIREHLESLMAAESAPPPVAASRQSAADSTPCTVCAGTGRATDDDLSPCPHCNPYNR